MTAARNTYRPAPAFRAISQRVIERPDTSVDNNIPNAMAIPVAMNNRGRARTRCRKEFRQPCIVEFSGQRPALVARGVDSYRVSAVLLTFATCSHCLTCAEAYARNDSEPEVKLEPRCIKFSYLL